MAATNLELLWDDIDIIFLLRQQSCFRPERDPVNFFDGVKMKHVIGGILMFLAGTAVSTAATVRLVAEGTVSLSTNIAAPAGSAAKLELLYDSSAADINAGPPFVYGSDAVLAADLTVGSVSLTFDPEPPGQFPSTSIVVVNDSFVAFGGDQLSVTIVDREAPDLGGRSEFSLYVLDESGDLLSGNDLPTSLSLENTGDSFDFTRIEIFGPFDFIRVDLTTLTAAPIVTSVAPVPLPASLPLFVVGLGLLGLGRLRFR